MEKVWRAVKQFDLPGEASSCCPYGNGHINDTFLVMCPGEDNMNKRYIMQAVNTRIFTNPMQVISNIEKITDFLKTKVEDPRGVLRMIGTKDGKKCYFDSGYCWRVYEFIEDSVCLETIENPEDFYQCAVAFGMFQRYLNAFPADTLVETLPDFHNTPKRCRDFLDAAQKDV